MGAPWGQISLEQTTEHRTRRVPIASFQPLNPTVPETSFVFYLSVT